MVGVDVLPVPPLPTPSVPVIPVLKLTLVIVLLDPLIVLLVNVSDPAKVASVPVVGNVTDVLLFKVKPRL